MRVRVRIRVRVKVRVRVRFGVRGRRGHVDLLEQLEHTWHAARRTRAQASAAGIRGAAPLQQAGAHQLHGGVLVAAERRGIGDPAAGVARASEAERGAYHL